MWSRAPVAEALADMIGAATGVRVFETAPEILTPPAVVVMRPQPVAYAVAAFGVDEATLPVTCAHGVEQEDALDAIKTTVRQAVLKDPTLGGVVASCVPVEERNWRNVTGAGGVQLLLVDLVLTVRM